MPKANLANLKPVCCWRFYLFTLCGFKLCVKQTKQYNSNHCAMMTWFTMPPTSHSHYQEAEARRQWWWWQHTWLAILQVHWEDFVQDTRADPFEPPGTSNYWSIHFTAWILCIPSWDACHRLSTWVHRILRGKGGQRGGWWGDRGLCEFLRVQVNRTFRW